MAPRFGVSLSHSAPWVRTPARRTLTADARPDVLAARLTFFGSVQGTDFIRRNPERTPELSSPPPQYDCPSMNCDH